DSCSIATVTSADSAVTSTGCGRAQTRTFTAKDACNNSSTASRTVTWTVDAAGPTITASGTTLSLACNPSAAQIDAALGTASADDTCSIATVTSADSAVTSTGCGRAQTRTFTAKDACNNSSTASRSVTWTVDTSGPTITATGSTLSLACNPSAAQIDAALGT